MVNSDDCAALMTVILSKNICLFVNKGEMFEPKLLYCFSWFRKCVRVCDIKTD